jgi:transcriptional regulator with XRE-family HTH domain
MSKARAANEELADYVRRIRADRGLSLNDVANKARQKGKQISSGYVSQIENRYIVSVTTVKLQALAAGLDTSEEEVFSVARGKAGSDDLKLNEMRLLEYFRKLSTESQDVLLAYAEMMSIRDSGKGRSIPLVIKGVDITQEKEKKRA